MKKILFIVILFIGEYLFSENISIYHQNLVNAVKKKKTKVIVSLIEKGANPNSLYNNFTILTYVLHKYNDFPLAKVLIENKANVNLMDNYGYYPLHYAVINNNLELINYLIDSNANVNCIDKSSNKTPLFYAIDNENMGTINLLIKKGANLQLKDATGKNALMYATSKSKNKVMDLLLKSNQKANYEDEVGVTPIILAVQSNNLNSVKLLAKRGANVNLILPGNLTPLRLALQKNHFEIAEYLVMCGAKVIIEKDNDAIFLSLQKFNISLFETLFKLNKNVLSNAYLNSLIEICLTSSNLKEIKFICNNSDIELQNELLFKAIENYSTLELFDYFKKKNLNFESTYKNHTLLTYAVTYENATIIKYFLENEKFNINKKNLLQDTPIILACKINSPEMVKLLLNYSPDITITDWSNKTVWDLSKKNKEIKKNLKDYLKQKKNLEQDSLN